MKSENGKLDSKWREKLDIFGKPVNRIVM